MEEAISYNRQQPSPKMKREKRMERAMFYMFITTVLVITAFAFITAAFMVRPSNMVLVDYDTREIRGEYRTTMFRNTEEMINAGIRFLDHYLSLNAATIEGDQLTALMMLSDEKRQQRILHLQKTNLVKRVQYQNAKAHVEVDKSKTKIITANGNMMKIEYKGAIIIDDSASVSKNTAIPFHIILDLEMVTITDKNTSGVKVVDYHEYGASDAFGG